MKGNKVAPVIDMQRLKALEAQAQENIKTSALVLFAVGITKDFLPLVDPSYIQPIEDEIEQDPAQVMNPLAQMIQSMMGPITEAQEITPRRKPKPKKAPKKALAAPLTLWQAVLKTLRESTVPLTKEALAVKLDAQGFLSNSGDPAHAAYQAVRYVIQNNLGKIKSSKNTRGESEYFTPRPKVKAAR